MEVSAYYMKYFLALTCLLLFAAAAPAHEFTTSVGLRTEYSDNSPRLPDDREEEDLLVTPRIIGDYVFEYPNLDARMSYTLQRRMYTRNTFQDRTDLVGEADITWRMVSDNLYWDFYQNNNVLIRESIEPETPDNETERSIFSTGPRLRIPVGNTNRIDLSARYTATTFDEEGLREGRDIRNRQDITDSERIRYSLLYVNDLNPVSAIRIRLERSDVEYDLAGFDYVQDRVGIGFDRNLRQLNYSVEVGRTSVDRDDRDSTSGVYVEARSRYETATTSIVLTATRDLTDTTTGLTLRGNLIDRLNPGDSNFARLDIVTRTRYELDIQRRLNARTGLNLRVSHDQQDFETGLEEEETTNANVSFRYELSPRSFASISIHGTEDRERFGDFEETKDTIRYQFDLGFTPSQELQLEFWVSKEFGDFDVSVRDRDYEELTAGVNVTYQLWRAR